MSRSQPFEARVLRAAAEVEAQLDRLLAMSEAAHRVGSLLAAEDTAQTRGRALDSFTLCLATPDPLPPN